MTALHPVDSAAQREPNREPVHGRHMADFGGARLYVYARGLGTVLRVDGEIDASNALHVAQAIRRFARLKTPLVLDTGHLEFLSVEGFEALLALNDEHEKAQVHCSVVTGPAMRPLMRIVTDHGLPIVESVPEALQLIDDFVRARRNFLSELVRNRPSDRQKPRAS